MLVHVVAAVAGGLFGLVILAVVAAALVDVVRYQYGRLRKPGKVIRETYVVTFKPRASGDSHRRPPKPGK